MAGLRRHPNCGVLLTGDFTQFNDKFSFKNTLMHVHQVKVPTRGQKNAIGHYGKVWTNMSPVYDTPITLSDVGSSYANLFILINAYTWLHFRKTVNRRTSH